MLSKNRKRCHDLKIAYGYGQLLTFLQYSSTSSGSVKHDADLLKSATHPFGTLCIGGLLQMNVTEGSNFLVKLGSA